MNDDSQNETLLERLNTQTKKLRVRREFEDLLFGQALTGSIVSLLIRVCLDVILLWCCIWGLRVLLRKFLPSQICTHACFARLPDECCLFGGATFLQGGVLAGLLFVGAYFSTRTAHSRRIQHSALVTVAMLLSAWFVLLVVGAERLTMIVFLAGLFVSMFFGYRLACKR